jgi:hypothetical protein
LERGGGGGGGGVKVITRTASAVKNIYKKEFHWLT